MGRVRSLPSARSALRVLSGAVIAALLVAVGAVGWRLAQVHEQYREWSLSPSAAPPKIPVAGRDYQRGSAATSVDPTLVRIAFSARHEVVYGPVVRTDACPRVSCC
jgi:hypothetical protein